MGDLDRRIRQVATLVDDAGRLATQLQGHRREVRRRLGRNLSPDRGGAGEEQVVERQRGKARGERRIAEDHAELLLIEMVVHQLGDQLAGPGREFAGLEHHPVSGRERGGSGCESQLNRIIPWRDDPHHPQRLALDVGGGRLQVDRRGHFDRFHPPRQVGVQVAEQAAQHEEIRHLGHTARPYTEIGLHRRAHRVAVPFDQAAQAFQPVTPKRQRHLHLGPAGLVLGIEYRMHGQGFLCHANDDRTPALARLERGLHGWRPAPVHARLRRWLPVL